MLAAHRGPMLYALTARQFDSGELEFSEWTSGVGNLACRWIAKRGLMLSRLGLGIVLCQSRGVGWAQKKNADDCTRVFFGLRPTHKKHTRRRGISPYTPSLPMGG